MPHTSPHFGPRRAPRPHCSLRCGRLVLPPCQVLTMLGFLVKNLTDAEVMVRYLTGLVNDHKKYGVKLGHYDMLIKTVGPSRTSHGGAHIAL